MKKTYAVFISLVKTFFILLSLTDARRMRFVLMRPRKGSATIDASKRCPASFAMGIEFGLFDNVATS
jgi:hypothetical protein